jgi:hypothetical protein
MRLNPKRNHHGDSNEGCAAGDNADDARAEENQDEDE